MLTKVQRQCNTSCPDFAREILIEQNISEHLEHVFDVLRNAPLVRHIWIARISMSVG